MKLKTEINATIPSNNQGKAFGLDSSGEEVSCSVIDPPSRVFGVWVSSGAGRGFTSFLLGVTWSL